MTLTQTIAIVWQPVILPMHIAGLAALLAGLAIFAYARTFRIRPVASALLLMMRLAVVAALAVLLMGPSTIPPETKRPGRPTLLVLADTSGSMQTADCDGLPRIAYARTHWLSDATLRTLNEMYDVQLRGFDEKIHPLSPAQLSAQPKDIAVGRSTHVAECLRDALQWGDSDASDGGDSAIMVVSDGRDSEDTPLEPVALLARARGIPVHAVCLGGSTLQRDLMLVAIPEQQYLLAGEGGNIIAVVHQVDLPQAKTTLHMECNGQQTSQPVDFAGKKSVTIKLPVKQDKTGLYEYKLRVDGVADEMESGNNAQSVFLEVTEQRIRVLVLEGEPHWDTKFLAQSLRKDARLELTQITRLSPKKTERIVTRAGAALPEIPRTAQELAAYDVVIIGRGMEHVIDDNLAKLLPEFVSRQGGHVIFARGRCYDPDLAEGRQLARDIGVLEPVVWGAGLVHNLRLAATPDGKASPCFAFGSLAVTFDSALERLPGFTMMPNVAREKTGTIVLATAAAPARAQSGAGPAGAPAIVRMDYGRGRVVAVLGEGLWQWSFLPPEQAEFDGVYDVFWSNLVRWLVMSSDFLPGQELSLRLNRSSIRLGDPLVVDATAKFTPKGGFHPVVKIIRPDGKEDATALGAAPGVDTRKQGSYTPETAGVYRVVLECPSLQPGRIEKKFNVYNLDFERLRTSADPESLRALAERTGGLFLQANQSGELPDKLARLRALRIVPRQPEFVWDKAALLVTLLCWAGVEWLVRRRAGLL